MLKNHPTKPCKHCGGTNHWSFQCFRAPKRKAITSHGKTYKQWIITRNQWIRDNPPNHQGYWECYLRIHEWCPRWLTIQTLTLDHVESRSRHKDKIFKQDNLKPACAWCNGMKGSRDADDVL